MADIDDFKLDDLEFQDFDSMDFDFEDPFSEAPEDTGRNPVEKVARATKKATIRNLKDPKQYIRTMRKALPNNYRRAWDIADEIKGQGNELYNRALGRAAPALKEIKRGLNKVVPSLRGKLPKGLLDKLEEMTTEYESNPTSIEAERDSQIAAVLAGTFSEQVKRDNERWEAEKDRTAAIEKSDKERHIESLVMLKAINTNTSRLVGYNDNITYKYQKSMLEVNYRQLFALRDIILTQQESARNLTKQMDAVIKNTGLPDAVKLRMTEQFGQLGRESVIKRFQEGLGGNLSNVITNLGKRLSDKVYNAVGSMSDTIEQMSMMASMGGGMPLTTMAGEMAGGYITDELSDLAADKLSGLASNKKLLRNDKFRGGVKFLRNSNAALGRKIANAPYALAEFARTDPNNVDPKDRKWYHASTDDYIVDEEGNYKKNGIMNQALGGALGFFRSVLQESLTKDGLEKRDASADMTKPASLTRRGLLSITDVIPGLLAMSLRELTMLRTGGDAPLMTYDYGRGRFETSEASATRISGLISERLSGKRNKRNVMDIVDELDPKKTLSDDDRQALARQLLHNNRNQRSFDVDVLGNANNYQSIEDSQTRERLAQFFTNNYSGTRDFKGDPNANVRMRKATENYSRLGSLIPSILDEMELQMNLGNSELLLEMGLLKFEDNSYVYNHDAIIDMIMEADDGEYDDTLTAGAKAGQFFYNALSKAKNATKDKIKGFLTPVGEQLNKVVDNHRVKSIRDYITDKTNPFIDQARQQWEKGAIAINEHRNSGKTIKDMFEEAFSNASAATKERYSELREEMRKLLTDSEYRDTVTKARIQDVEDIINDVEDQWGNVVIQAKELNNVVRSTLSEAYQDPRVQHVVGGAKDKFNNVVEKYQNDPKFEKVREHVEIGREFTEEQIQKLRESIKAEQRMEAVKEAISSVSEMTPQDIKDKVVGGIGTVKDDAVEKFHDAKQTAKESFANIQEQVKQGKFKQYFNDLRGSANAFYDQHVRGRFSSPNQENFDEKEQTKKRDKMYDIIEQILDVQKQALEEQRMIIKTLEAGIFVNADTGEKMGRMRTAFSKTWDMTKGVRSLTGNIFRGAGWAIKGAGYLTGKLGIGYGKMIGAGFNAASGILGAVGRSTRNMLGLKNDIFVEGNPYPVLHWKGIKEGIYQDLTTGKIVRKLSDIKGPVKNLKTNEPAITEDDFKKGLYDTAGKPVLRNVIKKIGSIYGGLLSPIATTVRFGANLYKATAGKIFEMKDVYTKKDMSTPKLYGSILKAGGYYSKKSGKVIKHYRDLDGEIIDEDRNIVLTLQDYKDGLCDVNGKPLKTFADRVLGLVGSGIGLVKNLTIGSVKLGWKALKGAFNLGKSIFSGIRKKININFGSIDEATYAASSETNMILEAIYTLLDDRLPGKKLFGDSDNDGIKEGSVADILRKRKEKKEGEEKAVEEKTGGKGGWMGKLTGMLGGLLGKKDKDGEEGDGDDGDTYIGGSIGGDGDVPDKDPKKKKGKKDKPKKLGKLGKWWQGIKNTKTMSALGTGARAVGGFGGRMLGRFAAGAAIGAIGGSLMGMGTLGAAVGGALSVVAGVLASPVVLTAAVVGAVGYGAYKLYKHLSKAELRDFRYLQYGLINLSDSQKDALVRLEDRMSKFVSIDGATANLKLSKEDIAFCAEEMGVKDKHVEEYIIWFMSRFKPIFLNYIAAIRSLKPGISIHEIDSSSFAPELKVKLLDMVTVAGTVDGPYSVNESPFGKETVVYSTSDIFSKGEELRAKYKKEVADNEKDGKKAVVVDPSMAVVAGDIVATKGEANATLEDRKKLAQRRMASAVPMGMGMYGMSYSQYNKSVQDAMPVKTSAPAYKASNEAIVDTKTAPSHLEIIRLKAYGLVELEILRVKQLLDMENELIRNIVYEDQKAVLRMEPTTILEQFGSKFGISLTDERQAASWLRWFNYRFVRVFLNFCTAVHQYNQFLPPMEAAKNLGLEKLLTVARIIISTKTNEFLGRSIWSISDSPWIGYQVNTDVSSAEGNVKVIEEKVNLAKFQDNVRLTVKQNLPEALQTPAIKGNGGSIAPLLSPKSNPSGTGRDNDNMLSKTDGRFDLSDTSTAQPHMNMGVYGMVTNGRISSDYGTRIHPISGQRSDHKGIDIAAPEGTPVYAAQDGIISRREYSNSYGNVIYIDHDDGNSTRYAHLQRFAQGHSVGSMVERGEIIGYVGNTGKSAGNHLHFEVRKGHGNNGTPMDPMKFLSDRYAKKALDELRETKNALKKEDEVNNDMTEGEDTISSTIKRAPEGETAYPKDKPNVNFNIDLPNLGGNKSALGSLRDTAPAAAADNIAPTSEDAFASSPTAYRRKQEEKKSSASEVAAVSVQESSTHQREMMKLAREQLQELRGINSGMGEVAGLLREMIKADTGIAQRAKGTPNKTGKADVVNLRKS